jgi:phosphonate transport system substrate-binding protein
MLEAITRRRSAAAALLVAALLGVPSFEAAVASEGGEGFRVGVVVPPGQDDTRRVDALRSVVAGATGSPPRIQAYPDIAALVDAQVAGTVDYAVYSATAFAVADRLCGCVEPLVAPSRASGATSQNVVLIGWADRVPDMGAVADARIAIAGDSIAGRWAPVAGLRIADTAFDPFADGVTTTSTASEAEALFVARGVDALFGWVVDGGAAAHGTRSRLEEAGVAPEAMVELWRSEAIPLGAHAVRSGVDAGFRRRLAESLLALDRAEPELHAALAGGDDGPFVAVTAQDYAFARRIVEAMAVPDAEAR